jgi:hypothetical protein
MSIVTTIDPTGYVSIQDDLWHIATSDNSGQINFKYVFDVYDKEGSQLVRVKHFPEPSNGKGYFNAGNVVRNMITYDWFVPETLVNSAFNTVINPLRSAFVKFPNASGEIADSYDIRYGEEYSLSGQVQTTLNLASGSVTAYNYLPKLWERRKFTLDDKSFRLLTNRPFRIRMDKNQVNHFFIGWLTDVNTPSWDVPVKAYNQSGAQILNDALTPAISYADRIIGQLDLSAKAINDGLNYQNNQTEGEPYVDYLLSAKYAIIEFGAYTGNDTIRIDYECSANEIVPLHFMNSYGVFETVIFDGANKLNMTVSRKGFEQRDYSFGSSSVNYYDSNNVYNESKINYYQEYDHNYKLTYANPDTAEYAWLAELIYSPIIYLEKDNNFYPVTIKNTNYQYNQVRFDRLKNLEIEVEINQKRNGFKR